MQCLAKVLNVSRILVSLVMACAVSGDASVAVCRLAVAVFTRAFWCVHKLSSVLPCPHKLAAIFRDMARHLRTPREKKNRGHGSTNELMLCRVCG